ncbi:MAG: hypothetical protein FD175_908 [Beijerinckiaceae bacterium]|nr:MAG: hypothetical protein FD175_908 [Beijerinckiaceae bacterium]
MKTGAPEQEPTINLPDDRRANNNSALTSSRLFAIRAAHAGRQSLGDLFHVANGPLTGLHPPED